ncbi:hypothetical protein [Bacillus marasmi]|nr:hypothetical protein [Bacillus marasmi]
MEFSIPTATWLWILTPMPMLIILSIITYFKEKERDHYDGL